MDNLSSVDISRVRHVRVQRNGLPTRQGGFCTFQGWSGASRLGGVCPKGNSRLVAFQGFSPARYPRTTFCGAFRHDGSSCLGECAGFVRDSRITGPRVVAPRVEDYYQIVERLGVNDIPTSPDARAGAAALRSGIGNGNFCLRGSAGEFFLALQLRRATHPGCGR